MKSNILTTTVFDSGNSQAVRLPKNFRFKGKKVEISKRGNEVILREIPHDLSEAYYLLTEMPNDFFAEGRKDSPSQERNF